MERVCVDRRCYGRKAVLVIEKGINDVYRECKWKDKVKSTVITAMSCNVVMCFVVCESDGMEWNVM